jgi:hypothetical protein
MTFVEACSVTGLMCNAMTLFAITLHIEFTEWV